MDLSKLKLEIYDLLGVILPGFLVICEGWILLRGWHGFVASVNQISGTAMTLLFVLAFGFGNIAQELGDVAVKTAGGKRYFRKGRDHFWAKAESQLVREAIKQESGLDISSVDTAFDYCLTKLKDRFIKRDVFVATSDLSRSFVVLSATGLLPAVRLAFYDVHPLRASVLALVFLLLLLTVIALLAWKRMVRFRELSEVTVFRAYLTLIKEPESRP